jgi:hypothetical protein
MQINANETRRAPAVPSTMDSQREPSFHEARRELKAAIIARQAADATAAVHRENLKKADVILAEARTEVARLKSTAEEAKLLSIKSDAKDIAAALREGRAVPDVHLPPDADLKAAEVTLLAVEQVHTQFRTEFEAAATKANACAESVRRIIDHILESEARAVAAELIAATQLSWECLDRLRGLLRIDERRETPALRTLQNETLDRINRQRAATARDPLMAETPRYAAYAEGCASEQERLWLAYAARLAESADAQFLDGDGHA